MVYPVYLYPEMILYWLFIVAVVIQCIYALYFFMRIFSLPKDSRAPVAYEGVSIIICAKNEADNLRENLPAVLSQRYSSEFEVIVVDDASHDNTCILVSEFEMQYDKLRHITVLPNEDRELKGKKHALSKGVEDAKFGWLLLIDADCIPVSSSWLQQMVTPLANGKEIVAGYSGYNKALWLLNAFVRWETLHTFLQYSTYALAGRPYMAVGRNMACTKTVLLQAQSGEVWNQLQSGDDDLLVSICGTENNTAIVCDKSAFTYSRTKATWREWTRQKQRHLSTGKYYKQGIKRLLGTYGASHAAMWLAFLPALFYNWDIAILVLAFRCFIYWLLWGVTAFKLREKDLIYLFPLFDIGWMVYNFVFFPYIVIKNKDTWR
jgi:glycosyltransferase involved in cell wall biosynthesis